MSAPAAEGVASVPAIYPCDITHARTSPVRNVFRYRSYLWLVDLDALPRHRVLAGFRAADHLGDPDASIRANVDGYLATQGIDLRGGRVLMLAAGRVLGHVFNPLSVFWCYRAETPGGGDGGKPGGELGSKPGGELACVIAEVHNTYGERHCYLIEPDASGAAEVDKAFYVSPFEPVEGRYRMSLPVPGPRLELVVTLHRPAPEDGGPPSPPFVAAVRGERRPGDLGSLLRTVARHPVAPLVAALRIRRQGIGLWLRGLPVSPRPAHRRQEAVQ